MKPKSDILGAMVSIARPRAWLLQLRAEIAQAAERHTLAAYSEDEAEGRALAEIDGGVDGEGTATIRIHGVIEHADPFISYCFGLVSPARIQAALDRYRERADVARVWLHIDSPGGAVTGLNALCAYIRDYPKPVFAIVGGECCSAAYWLANAAKSIAAEPEAVVGSIGVYQLIVDDSEAIRSQGLQFNYISTGPLKAAGATGMPLTEEQAKNIQRAVDDVFGLFKAAVNARRVVDDEVWAGGIYTALTGKTLGLVDILI